MPCNGMERGGMLRRTADLVAAVAIGVGLTALVQSSTSRPVAAPVAQVAVPRRTPWTARRIVAFLVNLYKEITTDRVLAVAAGVAFFGLMSLAPAVTAFVSLYGLFVELDTVSDHLTTLGSMVPASAYTLIEDQVTKLTSKGPTVLSLASVAGLGLSIWSANSSIKAMMDALNVAYGATERRGFFTYQLVSLAMTTGAVMLLIATLLVLGAIPVILQRVWLDWATEWLLNYGRWPLLFVLFVTGIAVLYRFGPSVPGARWRWISPGSVLAAGGIMAFSAAFSWYATEFANYGETYGPLGAVVAFMIWAWLSSAIVLIGAELNAELDRESKRTR